MAGSLVSMFAFSMTVTPMLVIFCWVICLGDRFYTPLQMELLCRELALEAVVVLVALLAIISLVYRLVCSEIYEPPRVEIFSLEALDGFSLSLKTTGLMASNWPMDPMVVI